MESPSATLPKIQVSRNDSGTEVRHPMVALDWARGGMTGVPVQESAKTLGDLKSAFLDRAALGRMDAAQVVYTVQWWSPVPAGDEGGLFWGVTTLQPGRVGDEYFMTHGHFHANATRAEYYGTIRGKGMLVQMDADRKTWAEPMSPGTLHYIRGEFAHRVVNVGDEPLLFWACWPSDAGYDYATIATRGFGARVVERDGQPILIAHE